MDLRKKPISKQALDLTAAPVGAGRKPKMPPPTSPVFEYNKPKPRWYTKLWRRPSRKQITAAVGGLAVILVAFLGFKLFMAGRHIITKNSNGAAPALAGDKTKLKGEGDGRINILLMGIGGEEHEGGDLTDTMMVVSIDPVNKQVAMLGIPRDLYVKVPGYGYNKINMANYLGKQNNYPGGGPALAKKTVENVLGVPIHYYGLVDFDGFRKAIDTVGGVDINVTQSLYDSEYPCDNNQARSCGFSLKAGQTHMNGVLALKYARCRKGNCGDDFGRAARQQNVLTALRQRAMSLGTLTNPAKVASLIDVVGDHAKTDLQLSEIKKLASIAKDIDTSKMTTKVLNNDTDGLVTTDMINGASVVIPKAGLGNYTAIQQFVRTIFIDNYLKQEKAAIEVQNGTGVAGLATTVGTLLKSYNYNVTSMVTAEDGSYPKTIIYDYTNGAKPVTIKYLQTRFGVTAKKATKPENGPDIRIILGSDYKAQP